jgi:hypothetical protein
MTAQKAFDHLCSGESVSRVDVSSRPAGTGETGGIGRSEIYLG